MPFLLVQHSIKINCGFPLFSLLVARILQSAVLQVADELKRLWLRKVNFDKFLFFFLCNRPCPNFITAVENFLHGCEIKSGSGLGTTLGNCSVNVWSTDQSKRS